MFERLVEITVFDKGTFACGAGADVLTISAQTGMAIGVRCRSERAVVRQTLQGPPSKEGRC